MQDTLHSIEFARGSPNSTWGSLRAAMGHPEPFELKYVAVGNEDCGKKYYLGMIVLFHCAFSLSSSTSLVLSQPFSVCPIYDHKCR